MENTALTIAVTTALFLLPLRTAYCDTVAPPAGRTANGAANAQQLAAIVPGHSTKADVRSLLGPPWREVQFNDCGIPMDDQGDETWEYRGRDGNGSYRIHVEFSDDGVVHLIGKIPDTVRGGEATSAKVAPPRSSDGMSM